MNLKIAALSVALAGAASLPLPAGAQQFPSGPGPIPLINALTAGIPNVIGYGRCAYGYRCGMYDHGGYRGSRVSRVVLPNGCIETRRYDPRDHRIHVHGECP